MKLNPILKRELRVQSRGYTLTGLICALNIALFLVSILGSLAVSSRIVQDHYAEYDSYLMVFLLVNVLSFLLILLISPSVTAGSIAGERRAKTLDLLLATRMSPAKIVFGKLFSSLLMVCILVISTVPAAMVPLMYGGAGLMELSLILLALFCGAFLCLSLGLFVSSFSDSPQRATALSYILLIVLCLGTVLPGLLFAPFYGGEGNNSAAMLLLLDPVMTMASVSAHALSGNSFISLVYSSLGLELSEGLIRAYIPLSLLLELGLGALFLCLSIRNISIKGRGGRRKAVFGIEKNADDM